MPSLISNRHYQPDYSPLNQAVSEAIFYRRQDNERERQAQLKAEQEAKAARIGALKSDGAKMLNLIEVQGLDAKKAGLLRIANAAYDRGENIAPYEEMLSINNPDELDLAFTQFATGVRDADKALEDAIKSRQPGEGFTLSGGETRFDSQGNEIASVEGEDDDKLETAEGKIIADRELITKQFGADSPQLQAFNEMVEAEQAGEAPSLSDVSGLRKEFTKSSQDFIKIRDAYSRIQSSSDTGPGDVSLIFGFMKLIDPGSTVREGEFATAEQTQGVPDRVVNLYNKAINGERLGQKARNAFKSEADNLFQAQKEKQLQLEAIYSGLASRASIDPGDVAVDYIGDLRNLSAKPVETGDALTEAEREELRQRRAAKEKRGRY